MISVHDPLMHETVHTISSKMFVYIWFHVWIQRQVDCPGKRDVLANPGEGFPRTARERAWYIWVFYKILNICVFYTCSVCDWFSYIDSSLLIFVYDTRDFRVLISVYDIHDFCIRNGRSIILGNGAFSLILGTIFLAQLGNALLASTLPLFARQVTESCMPAR